jgi:hypothetical protein
MQDKLKSSEIKIGKTQGKKARERFRLDITMLKCMLNKLDMRL